MSISQITILVRSTEIDVNGHVNNAKYLEYYEWGREDWYEEHHLHYDELHRQGVVTVVARAEVDYRQPAKQNDVLTITSWIVSIGKKSFRMKQHITGIHGQLISEAIFVIVTVHPTQGIPVPVPDAIRQCAP